MRRMYSENQLKEVVNKGIQEGEIEIPKEPTLDDIQYEFDGDNNECAIIFPKGIMPEYLWLRADDNQESYVYIGVDKASVKNGYSVGIYNDGTDFKLIANSNYINDGVFRLEMDYDDAFHRFKVVSMTYKKLY